MTTLIDDTNECFEVIRDVNKIHQNGGFNFVFNEALMTEAVTKQAVVSSEEVDRSELHTKILRIFSVRYRTRIVVLP